MNCKNGNVNWKTQTGRWSKNTQNKEIVLHKQRSVSDKLYILLMSGLTLLQTLTSSAHAALPYSTVWIPWAPWRLHWHLVIKWSNDILQTRCFAGPPCSCWLTGGPYVITALRPPHKKKRPKPAHRRLISNVFSSLRPFSPHRSVKPLWHTGLSTHAGAADACTELLNSLSLALSPPSPLLSSRCFSPSLPPSHLTPYVWWSLSC